MRPDTPLEAATHYLWPLLVFVVGVLGWFIRRSIVSFETVATQTGKYAMEARDTGLKLTARFDAHEVGDDKQFMALWETVGDIENRERDRLLTEAKRRRHEG